MIDVLKQNKYKCSVSSVLNKDIKQFGKTYMFDDVDDTSWSSDQGVPQWIVIQWEEEIQIKCFELQFQGGFAGKELNVRVENRMGQCVYDELYYPEDNNTEQKFFFHKEIRDAFKIKLTFLSSTDFYGRIVVYKLGIYK